MSKTFKNPYQIPWWEKCEVFYGFCCSTRSSSSSKVQDHHIHHSHCCLTAPFPFSPPWSSPATTCLVLSGTRQTFSWQISIQAQSWRYFFYFMLVFSLVVVVVAVAAVFLCFLIPYFSLKVLESAFPHSSLCNKEVLTGSSSRSNKEMSWKGRKASPQTRSTSSDLGFLAIEVNILDWSTVAKSSRPGRGKRGKCRTGAFWPDCPKMPSPYRPAHRSCSPGSFPTSTVIFKMVATIKMIHRARVGRQLHCHLSHLSSAEILSK